MSIDCSGCKGLCCIWYGFEEWDKWIPLVKESGERCEHLTDDFRCRVEETLKPSFSICVKFDCKGVGTELCKQHPDASTEDLAYSLVLYNLGRSNQEKNGVSSEKLQGAPWVKMEIIEKRTFSL